jgi:alkylation response protein AidB-like acyl-CoA dehydrogenase
VNLIQTYFSEDHQTFRASFKAFLEKEVLPHVEAWEEAGEVPRYIYQKMGEMGYFGLGLPEDLGGSGLDFFYDVIFLEELGKINSGGFGAAIGAHVILTLPHLFKKGSPYLQEKYLKPAIQGKIIGALGITEPHAGSDVAGLLTTATETEGGYLINGSKMFITNGVNCDYYVLAAKTNPHAGPAGISLFVVDAPTPGLSRTKLKKLGWRASDTGDIAFDNVFVPAENLLGEPNQGFLYIMQRFELERLSLAISSNALCEDALEKSLQYMNEREAFGRKINKFQELRHRIAQLSSELEMSRVFTYQACKMYDQGIYAVKEAAMAKLLATELADKCTYQCLQFFGGYGYMEDYPLARMWRDARLGTIGGGSSEIMREIIAKMVVDKLEYRV